MQPSPSRPSPSYSPSQRPRKQQASTSTKRSSASTDIELSTYTPRSQLEESPFSDHNSVSYNHAHPQRVVHDFARTLDYGDAEMSGSGSGHGHGHGHGSKDITLDSDKEQAFLKAYERFSSVPEVNYHQDAHIEYPPIQSPPPTPYPSKTMQDHPDLQPPSPPTPSTFDELVRPRFRLLFNLTTKRDYFIHILPACILSIIASIIPPYMTVLIGDLFIPFSAYPIDQHSATSQQSSSLICDVSAIALKLALVGAAGFVVHTLVGRVWIGYGERVADRLRRRVYESVIEKDMAWFDLGMGMKTAPVEEEDDGSSESVGAGGLMAKFARETDDVRQGCSLAMGSIIQQALTFILCIVLALIRSPILALVTLSAIPLVLVSHLITQSLLTSLYTIERRAFAEASTHIERSTAAISTVKAFNAQKPEHDRFRSAISNAQKSLEKQGKIWGIGEGLVMFFTSVMFVAGFWFGAKLVREGKNNVGDVMTVFWACMMASSSLQAIVPDLATVSQAKHSMASQLTIINSGQQSSSRPASLLSPFLPTPSPLSTRFSMQPSKVAPSKSLRRIRPSKCRGEFVFRNLSFAYPSRPDQLVLNDVSMFLPAGETTFVVGGSGSGKSTIAQLLLKLYRPMNGDLTMDDQDFTYLDEQFTREHIAAVQQGCILFDMSVHDNVALGVAGSGASPDGTTRKPEEVTRDQVISACKMALIHDFVVGLPDGYDTMLGTSGSSLSGGQKQRLSIARARLRDPTILILDEATSALDATSRVLVFEALKQWRKNKTTIVITHDLSQIQAEDFVYVMKDGAVVEQGFRSDLVTKRDALGLPGVFAAMAQEQSIEPLPMTEGNGWRHGHDQDDMEELYETDDRRLTRPGSRMLRPHTPSFQFGLRPGSAVYLGILDDYARGARDSLVDRPSPIPRRPSSRLSLVQPRPSSIFGGVSVRASRTSMVQSSPNGRTSAFLAVPSHASPGRYTIDQEVLDDGWEKGPRASASLSTLNSPITPDLRRRWTAEPDMVDIKIETPGVEPGCAEPEFQAMGALRLIQAYFPGLPSKYLLVLGLLGSVAHGVITPIWSSYISVLMSFVSTGGVDTSGLSKNGIILICLCIAQATAIAIHASCLDLVSNKWAAKARDQSFSRMITQDKSWFDQAINSPSRLMQIMIKDADDMRALMSTCIGHLIVASTMIGLGLIWAMVVGWRLTLVGLAIAPIFGILMVVEATLLSKMETLNKRRREDVARAFYESVSNVRPVRAMALEGIFHETFEGLLAKAHASGVRAGWVKGFGSGASSALPFFAQALLNWVSAIFMTQGYYNYAQTLQVYALVLFSITFGSQMLDFVPEYAKSRVAASDFHRLYNLSIDTEESHGELRFPITGNVVFDRVSFAYPTRPKCPILSDVSFKLAPGETVAIVGPSGSGKSTVAALLQRLYEPSTGNIFLDRFSLGQADVKWLRNHIAVVSQNANLFDGTIADNIAYGSDVPIGEIHRAAKAASVHSFIMSLPDGYETNLGENASLISGGQAQRLQIARALVRRSSILILDECTSALDVDNARAVLDTIVKVKEGRTTIFITHSAEAMKRCDRILCLGEGRIVEDGSYEELISRRGVFSQLMSMGEWE